MNNTNKDTVSAGEIINHINRDAELLGAQSHSTDTLVEITATDLLNRKVESIPCLIEPILQSAGLAAVVGSSDVGKSAFLRQLAFAVATKQNGLFRLENSG